MPSTAPVAVAARPRLRVLVVEDAPDDFDLLVAHLRKGPWRVEAARVEDAQGLAGALAEGRWDVVISDHSLPRFDSGSALRVLREAGTSVPFVIVSGRIGEDVAVDAMLAGADDYVMKHNLARLRPAIERAVAAHELRRGKVLAERRERESEARLAAIAANLPGVVFRLRRSGRSSPSFVYLSDGAAALFGQPAAALLANPQRILELSEAGSGESLASCIAASALSGGSLLWEGKVGRKGEARWVSVSATSSAGEDGAQIWDGIMVDITAQKSAEEKLRALTVEWESRVEAERSAVARELHDDVGGSLAALKVDIDWTRRHSPPASEVQRKLADMDALVDGVIAATSRISLALRPGLIEMGIVAAIEAKAVEFARRLGIPCEFRTNDEALSLPAAESTALYRVLQEALTNVTRHAQATHVAVELFGTEREVTLEVRDNGRGFTSADLAKKRSFGVRGMRERIGRLGGWLDLSSEPGRGSTVMVALPRGGKGARA